MSEQPPSIARKLCALEEAATLLREIAEGTCQDPAYEAKTWVMIYGSPSPMPFGETEDGKTEDRREEGESPEPCRAAKVLSFRMRKTDLEGLRKDGGDTDVLGVFEVLLDDGVDGEKIHGVLRVGDDLESVLRRVGIVAVPSAKAPVRGVAICQCERDGGGRSSFLREVTQYAERAHDALGESVVGDDVYGAVFEWMWNGIHSGGTVEVVRCEGKQNARRQKTARQKTEDGREEVELKHG